MKSMKMKSAILALALLAISPALTACDPPMPPEVLAQLGEQNITCESGDVSIYLDSNLLPALSDWNASLAENCTDPVMTASQATDSASASIVLSASVSAPCQAFLSTPIAYDAGVLAFMLTDADTLAVSPSTLAGIINGSITRWNDPAIAADNPDIDLPNLAITLRKSADAASLKSLTDLLGANSQSVTAQFDEANLTDGDSLEPLNEGDAVILPASVAYYLSYPVMGLTTGAKDADGYDIVAQPDVDGVFSAETQLVVNSSASQITAKLDPALAPKSVFEGVEPATPYQAIFPINLYACGSDNTLSRSMATYLLRLDSQGYLNTYNLNGLPEEMRQSASALTRQGLPLPTAIPESSN